MPSKYRPRSPLALLIGWHDVAPGTRARLLKLFCAGIGMRSLISNTVALVILAGNIVAEDPKPVYIGWLAALIFASFLTRLYARYLLRLDRFDHAPDIQAFGFLVASAIYGTCWGVAPFLMLPHLSGPSISLLMVILVCGTFVGPYAAIPGILYVRLAVAGTLTLTAIAIYMSPHITFVSCVFAGWLVLRSDVWRGYHRALCEQLDLRQALEQRQRALEQTNDDKEQANRELRVMAETDPLTGAGNRRQMVAGLHDIQAPAALILFDIDHFKAVNDRLGHECGDALLVALVKLTRETLRADDLLVRLGGDEFAILLPATSADVAWTLAERIRQRVAQQVVHVGEYKVTATVSLGIALATVGTEEASASDLLREADAALYVAKRQGRDRVRGAEPIGTATTLTG